MNKKLLMRLLCALLSVLMLVCMIPAITVSAAEDSVPVLDTKIDYTSVDYKSAEERLAAMTQYYSDDNFSLYCDQLLGVVGYRNNKTGEILFTNPWNMTAEKSSVDKTRAKLMSQITLSYVNSKNEAKDLTSYTDAVLKGQIAVKTIKNGLRVEYVIGERSARTLVPQMIEAGAFEEKILKPLGENAGFNSSEYRKLKAYFNEMFYVTYMADGRTDYAEAIATEYPITKEKGIDIYVLQYDLGNKVLRELESWIMEYCPEYTFEEMDNDHAYVEFEEESVSPPVFKMALEYTVDANGLSVTLPANGLRYDETAYRVTDLSILPYMGACNSTNQGYSFIPDGSGAIFDLSTTIVDYNYRVYGEDYSLDFNVSDAHNQTIRMPVYGQVETEVLEDGTTGASRGYLAIIESGESLASLHINHQPAVSTFSSIIPSFVTRQDDKASQSSWDVYACRRYVDDYKIRYIMLSDDTKAAAAGLTSYYECSWMGMACAYRDYLSKTNEGYQRLTDADVKTSLPLYLETFGCMDSIEKVMSMPVTVSVPLTTFEDVAAMYDYLAGEGVTNVNFKLTGFANGGMYSEMPYKLKWEKSVGGKGGFEDLTAYAAEKGFSLYPDFDFVFTTQGDGGSKVNMKKNAARTIDNRYTSRRVYSATKQSLVSYYQMVMSPDTYSHFYEKLGKKYAKYENATGISLESFGNALNSDYDENKTVLREEAKEYVIEALAYFKQNYDIMLDGGNAFTWGYADHILNVPLDSSRYNYEKSAVPFMGVVLHGYVEFAGSPLNMEGNLSYAMLKAMENGASIYFVLSYANTELLKEDVLLSQNYSVRYDIWQSRLVDIYEEINAVLADVQTKLIIDHKFLEGNRVADQDELLQDIADAAADKAAEIEAQLKAEHDAAVAAIRQARIAATTAAATIDAYIANDFVTKLQAQRVSNTTAIQPLANYWKLLLATPEGESFNEGYVTSFKLNYRSTIQNYIDSMRANVADAATLLQAAKDAHAYLISVDADQMLIDEAAAGVVEAQTAYDTLMAQYNGNGATFNVADFATEEEYIAFLNDYILGSVTDLDGDEDVDADDKALYNQKYAAYDGIGAEALYDAYIQLMKAQGLYDLTTETPDEELPGEGEGEETPGEGEGEGDETPGEGEGTPGEGEGEGEGTPEEDATVVPDPPKSKYAIDNDIVLVTYGEEGAPYKSIILNFNDYAVQTTYNGVIYTIEAYGYVVIYY
ncbi:MAG: hypothetical protein IJY50_07070 [Clostridia bacterium]|nr:hypothetical protein [Clostridia bacterium]